MRTSNSRFVILLNIWNGNSIAGFYSEEYHSVNLYLTVVVTVICTQGVVVVVQVVKVFENAKFA